MPSPFTFVVDLNDNANAPKPQRSPVARSSLACLPCRSRHLRCDGKRPQCSRCIEATKQCCYAKSRRGGLDRATLAKRRKQLAAEDDVASEDPPATDSIQLNTPDVQIQELCPNDPLMEAHLIADRTCPMNNSPSDTIYTPATPGAPPRTRTDLSLNVEHDPLIDSYYQNFHHFHPLVVPQRHLTMLCQDASRMISLRPLLVVMRLIGHLYDAKEWSTTLQGEVEATFAVAARDNLFMVPARTLYSIALFWHGLTAEARGQMQAGVRLALDLKMFRQEFAMENAPDDAVLRESWRRTWWTLYIVDAFYAGTLGTMNFTVVDVEATVDLPCEEGEYESGTIPQPQTLSDFDCREFSNSDTSFSSFAYLIGAVRCAASAVALAPKIASKKDSPHVIQTADSILDGWLLLLPQKSKPIMSKSGEIDELIFQAHLVIHVSIIGLHRPLSDLKFNAVEHISSCARPPPPDNPTPDLINVHTTRVLRSIEAQIRLLALPARPFSHTPFTTCMVSEGTLALLSACKFLLQGKELAVARNQIRMTIGCLRTLGEVWSRTARNLQEIQTIARHALGFEAGSASSGTPSVHEVPSLASVGATSTTLGSDGEASSLDIFAAMDTMDGVCGWYNFGELGSDMPWWTNE